MTLSTHPEDRREMVRALSERLQTPAVYMRTPNYAFQINSPQPQRKKIQKLQTIQRKPVMNRLKRRTIRMICQPNRWSSPRR